MMDKIYVRLDALGEKLKKKECRIPVNLAVGVVFFLFSAVILLTMPQQVAVSEKDVVNGRAFPELLMGVMMLCCVLLVAKDIYKLVRKQPVEWKTLNLLVEIKALVILGILLITYILWRASGFFVLGAIFCALAFLIYFRCKKPSYYAITVGMAVGIWAVFRFLLNVRL